MIVVAGLWELSWDTPMTEMRHWETTIRDFEVDNFYMSPVTGIKNKWVVEKHNIDEVLELYPSLPKIYITETGDIPLSEFEHPKDALYIFGKGNYSPFNNLSKKGDYSVRIEIPAKKDLLLATNCATVILYDRFIKNGFNSSR